MTIKIANWVLLGVACAAIAGCGASEDPGSVPGAGENVTTRTSKLVSVGCADGNAEESFASGMVGCAGKVSWDNRRYLCGPGFRPATAEEWAIYGGVEPHHDYWTDDDLRFSGTADACSVALNSGASCTPGKPMRVCTVSGIDAEGNTCGWRNCGFNGATNKFFGGCVNDPTAGTLCIPEGCADGTIEQVMPNGFVGCGGAVSWANRELLCAPGYRSVTSVEWQAMNSFAKVTPTHDYWTADNLGFAGTSSACRAVAVGGTACTAGRPMRVCTPSGGDIEGNTCTWTNCGLNTTTPNLYFGGCSANPTAGAICAPVQGCADRSVEQVFPNGAVGCAGSVTWANRDTLCGRGYRTATADEWRNLSQIIGPLGPTHNYWTADDLKRTGSTSNCSASTTTGTACPAGQPMHLCTGIGTDAEGNACAIRGCGLDTVSPILNFGGCTGVGNSTAGALCVPADVQPALIQRNHPTIRTILEKARTDFSEVPGIAAAVVVDGNVYLAAVGKRKWTDSSLTLQETDSFDLGSVSKVVSGAVAARAVDQGTLSWNDTLVSRLPSIFNGGPPNPFPDYMDVTLAELNAHASGMGWDTLAHNQKRTQDAADDYVNNPNVIARKVAYTRDAVLDLPIFPNGAAHAYGGGAISAISMLETTVATPFDTLLQNWLFRALGMTRSGSQPNIWQHTWSGTNTLQSSPGGNSAGSLRLPVGGGSASIEDMARFAHAMMYSPRAPWHFWSYKTQQTLENSVGRSGYSPAGWVLTAKNISGGLEFWKNGSNCANTSSVVLWPARRIAFVILTNHARNCGSAALGQVYNDLIAALGPSFNVPAAVFPYQDAHTYQLTNVSATSTYSPDFDASKAFDGDYNTRWAAPGGVTSATLQLLLPWPPRRVGHVVINEGGPFAPTPPVSGPLNNDVTEFRVTSYELYLTTESGEVLASTGTSIGVNKMIAVPDFGGITAARLVMTGTNGPTITEMHLLPW